MHTFDKDRLPYKLSEVSQDPYFVDVLDAKDRLLLRGVPKRLALDIVEMSKIVVREDATPR